MSSARALEKRLKKPPACDMCKARRVLCHPQPDGRPCPRCVEKNVICTTTPVARGRPRKHPAPVQGTKPSASQTQIILAQNSGPVFQSSLNCPELTPEFVAHCFEGIRYAPQYNHPLIAATSIRRDIHAVSYQIHCLSPQSRVLALCIVCAASLASFHPTVLGSESPCPQSFTDTAFFESASNEDLLACGVRRSPVFRALRDEALKAAWETGIMLQPSNENAASCFLLDIMEQSDFCGASRPWASAYMSHVRALAPLWHAAGYTTADASQWAGYMLSEALISARSRTPLLVTANDQLLLTGPAPPPLDAFLTSLERASKNPSYPLLWTSLRPYLYHVTTLSRQLSETIAGDYPRLHPLSEGAVIKYLTSLSMLQSILALLLERAEACLSSDPSSSGSGSSASRSSTSSTPASNSVSGSASPIPRISNINVTAPIILDAGCTTASPDTVARAAACGLVFGFAGLVLPFYRELEYRETADGGAHNERTRERLRLLKAQARDMALQAVSELGRALRLLPPVHYTPVHYAMVYAWAEFCADEVDTGAGLGALGVEAARTLDMLARELQLLGYSLHSPSTPTAVALIERLNAHVRQANGAPGPAIAMSSSSEASSPESQPQHLPYHQLGLALDRLDLPPPPPQLQLEPRVNVADFFPGLGGGGTVGDNMNMDIGSIEDMFGVGVGPLTMPMGGMSMGMGMPMSMGMGTGMGMDSPHAHAQSSWMAHAQPAH